MIMKSRFVVLMILFLPLLIFSVSACSNSEKTAQVELTLASESMLPDFVRDTPPQVQEAYRFAIANPDVLKYIPCYCGCGGMGHDSNLNCYVAAFHPDGSVAQFDNHAAY
jgi:hypothetical protein